MFLSMVFRLLFAILLLMKYLEVSESALSTMPKLKMLVMIPAVSMPAPLSRIVTRSYFFVAKMIMIPKYMEKSQAA